MKKSTGTIIFWGVSALVIIAAVLVVVMSSSNDTSNNGGEYGAVAELGNDDWEKGNLDATAVLVEYSDFQCPACGSYYPIVKDLTEEFEDDLLVVYRHLPLKSIHANAEIAALAAEAAGFQGKFWEMHDLLFENQAVWSAASDPTELFSTYAEDIGLNMTWYDGDIISADAQKEVDADLSLASSAGIQSTPTFFLNGERIQPGSYDEFRDLILDEIEDAE